MSCYAWHSRCNTSSTCRVFSIHLSIPCCIYLLLTVTSTFAFNGSPCDVFGHGLELLGIWIHPLCQFGQFLHLFTSHHIHMVAAISWMLDIWGLWRIFRPSVWNDVINPDFHKTVDPSSNTPSCRIGRIINHHFVLSTTNSFAFYTILEWVPSLLQMYFQFGYNFLHLV